MQIYAFKSPFLSKIGVTGHELTFKMNAKTRWSSTEMLSRLSILSGPVNEILEEINSFHLMLTPDEVEEL